MKKGLLNKKILRLVDANFNRLKEGLRVCEDISRFIFDDTESTKKLKRTRHQILNLIKRLPLEIDSLIDSRDSKSDVSRSYSIKFETKRTDSQDIFRANIQRIKESLRVLEEFSKLFNQKISLRFKSIRYQIYSLEQEIIQRFCAVEKQ